MKIYSLSSDTRTIDVDLGSTGLNTVSMALELVGLGETSFSSVSQADIQELGGNLYRITFSAVQVNRPGFLLFSLTGPGFDPFIGLLYTVYRIEDDDPISGVPVNRESFLPVAAFDGITPVTGLIFSDFDVEFTKADTLTAVPKTLVDGDVLELENEFGDPRGVYLMRFDDDELDRIGAFKYSVTTTGPTFDPFSNQIQVTESAKTHALLDVLDSQAETTTTPRVPTAMDLTAFIGTSVPVNHLDFRFSQFGFGYVDLEFAYFNGSIWVALTVQDGTSGFTEDGIVDWELPTGQAQGGTGAPNQADYFIRISATAVSGDAILAQVDPGVGVEGVSLMVLDPEGNLVVEVVTGDTGRAQADLEAGTYIVVLMKGNLIFSFNNVLILVQDVERLSDFGIEDGAQRILLAGASTVAPTPVVAPDLVTLKADLITLSGNPVQRQGIRLEHRFDPSFRGGTHSVIGHPVRIETDIKGHAEIKVIAGAVLDIFVQNLSVSRQVTVPQPRAGVGDTLDPAPTVRFKASTAAFTARDLNGIIEIAGDQYIITSVVDTTELEVSPAIPTDLVAAVWDMKKIDIFALIALMPDQFEAALPTFPDLAIRSSF
jgi:hypothetical protein